MRKREKIKIKFWNVFELECVDPSYLSVIIIVIISIFLILIF